MPIRTRLSRGSNSPERPERVLSKYSPSAKTRAPFPPARGRRLPPAFRRVAGPSKGAHDAEDAPPGARSVCPRRHEVARRKRARTTRHEGRRLKGGKGWGAGARSVPLRTYRESASPTAPRRAANGGVGIAGAAPAACLTSAKEPARSDRG